MSSSENTIWPHLIQAVPKILWVLVFLITVYVFYPPIRASLERGIATVEIGSVKLELLQAETRELPQVYDGTGKLTDESSKSLAYRILHAAPYTIGGRILWVDDHITSRYDAERATIRRMGISIDITKTTEDAKLLLKHNLYDVIISDLWRGDNRLAGVEFIRFVEQTHPRIKSIVYGQLLSRSLEQGMPNSTFRVTTLTNDLMHAIISAMEEIREPVPGKRADQPEAKN